MKRGDVYEYGVGSHVVRIVVTSADRYNPNRATCAPVVMTGVSAAPTSVVVAVTVPIHGHVDVTRLRAIDPTAIRARLGRLTVSAQRQVDQALLTYLDLH